MNTPSNPSPTAARDLPIIIGCGINGLAVSRSLSRQRIAHRLIGTPVPLQRPCLGESMDAVCTLDLEKNFSDGKAAYFQKADLDFHIQGTKTNCNFNFQGSPGLRKYFKTLGLKPLPGLYHVDRIGFDDHVFTQTVASQYCQHLDGRVADITVANDTVQALELDNGQRFEPRFVFDCSNHAAVLPRAMGLKPKTFGKPQRVAFTHYRLDNPDQNAHAHWRLATSLVRTEPDQDQISGFGWVIPIGDHVSLGVSVNDEDPTDLTDEQILEHFALACRKRGVPLVDHAKQVAPTRCIRNTHFAHDKVHGANWVLSGPTACQVWFSTGTAVGFATFAAALAPQLMKRSRRAQNLYQQYITSLRGSHDVITAMREDTLTPADMTRFTNKIYVGNGIRMGLYAQAIGNPLRTRIAQLLTRMTPWIGRNTDFCNTPVPSPADTPAPAASAEENLGTPSQAVLSSS